VPSVTEFLSWLESTDLSIFLQESSWAFPTIESIHVLALTMVVGTISIVDLRLLGLASTKRRVSELSRLVLPCTWGAFALALTTGSLMVISQPTSYYDNDAFRTKMLLLLAAGINMLIFQSFTYQSIAEWDRDARVPLAGRIAGAVSLTCWLCVVFFGRRIGFTIAPG
jgi:hypothetical protein